ncbi:hypothetical protein BGZ47_006615 [Haplosporangium gracile]|nr:hypothetical protein BGZ47_006615 [Haplosporangium gracile]
MNPTSGNAFGSAFGGQGMTFGGGNNGNTHNINPNGSAFASTRPGGGGSAFGNAGTGGGGGSPSAFGAFGGGNSGASAFNNNTTVNASGAPGAAFNSGGSFNSYNQSAPGQNQFGATDGHSDNSRGRGRGRGGNSSYRGGRGGGNRGSANMTYVAPGLSINHGQQQQQHQPQNRSQLSSVFTAGSPGGESDLAFSTAGSNRGGGRGGYSGSPRGRGRGGAAGVPGQFRSIQWRPTDGAQSNSTNQGSDSAMAMDSTSDISNSASPSAVNTSSSGGPGSLQQHAAFSAFGAAGQSTGFGGANQSTGFSGNNQNAGFASSNQNAGFAQQTGAGSGFVSSFFNKERTPAASTATPAPAFQGSNSGSAFGIHTSVPAAGSSTTSAFSSAITAPQGLTASTFRKGGFTSSSPSIQDDSIFATPTSRPVSSSSTSHPGQPTFTPSAKASPSTTDNSASRQISGSTEDADSRLNRFSTNTLSAKEFEKLKDKREQERQDAIRAGLIPDPDKPRRLEDAITFVGTCMDMCPEFERHEREFQINVEKFEKIPGTEKIDHLRAVKAYARPAAGKEQPLPSDVRPPTVLLSTLDYLINQIVGENDLADSHFFVRDRTRSIRQDFTLQNNRGLEAIRAHEIIARYHILCMHQLCENKGFSDQQEMEQLRKVLTSLQEFYDDMRSEGIPCPNEAEFRAYHMLSHLRDPDMIRQAQRLPLHIFRDPYIQVAAEIHALTRRNNDIHRRAKIQSEASPNFFSRFFKLVAGAPTTYLMACLLEVNFAEIRKGALKAMNKCYLDQHDGFPVEDLVAILGFDNAEECMANCEEYGLALAMDRNAVIFGRKDPATRRRIFKEGSLAMKQHRNERIVEAKRQNYTAAQIIYGTTPPPQPINAISNAPQAIGPSAARPTAAQPLQGRTSASAALRQSTQTLTAKGSSTGAASSPASTTTISQPATSIKSSGIFDFGLGGAATPQRNGVTTSAASTQGSLLPSVFSAAATVTHGAAAAAIPLFNQGFSNATTSSSVAPPVRGQQSVTSTANNVRQPASLFTNPAAAGINPSGFSVSAPPVSTLMTASTSSAFTPALTSGVSSTTGTPAQSSTFIFKTPETRSPATASPFNFNATGQTPASNVVPSLSLAPTLGGIATSTSKSPGAISIPPISAVVSVQPPTPTRSSLFTTPPPLSPSSTPKSDVTRIVTKRGRIYPRPVVESIVKELLDSETDRLIRMTAAQMSQELVVERSVRRAKERQDTIQRESMRLMTEVVTQIAEETIEEILAEIYRDTKVQRRVVSHWRSFTVKSIQRAEELRRRQEHFLSNVRAMGSRAGLTDAEPWTVKVRDQNSARQLPRTAKGTGQAASDIQGIKAMVASNKRKRLLSIGQEGSPDLALVAGLKKAAAPKQEMWAPLPVLEIVESRYNKRPAAAAGDSTSEDQQGPRKSGGLTKRRWRLFVGTPNFKETTSKWLLRKLGVDMSRPIKPQQRSGTMVAEHPGRTDSETSMDVIVHGSEDASVMDLLGMSKYEIMETAAFMFEFSKIPFADHEATEQAIRQYWLSERARLVRFLSCFPKVKQPIVFILWTSSPEIWERMSPRMVEYLELNAMVKSPKAPLLGYRFLNMDMSTMKLDRFVTGSLEWLATETKDYFEDPAAMLSTLLDKYRPIFEWALCRISLAEGPWYSQYDEEDEEEANMWLLKQKQRKKLQEQRLLLNGVGVGGAQLGNGDLDHIAPPRNLFVESVETGFNLAVRLFNMELENIAQTIEAKGQGETREGAAQEGRVKDAMARFIRQAELPEMKPGSILDRIHFGMDSKSAFCDFMDVYLATLGGLAKESQNQEAKATMRTEIWKLLRSSTEDRVPLEAIFKRISSQVLTWIKAGILDTERFSIRLKKWESLRNSLEHQQNQYRQQQQQLDNVDWEDDNESDLGNNGWVGRQQGQNSDMSFTPLLIHDEVDVDENVFDFETTAQSEVRIWERTVEKQAREREERALAVPVETSSLADRAGLTVPSAIAANRFGDSRKRRAPESPRETLKKSRMQARSALGLNRDNDDENLFKTSNSLSRPSSPPNGTVSNTGTNGTLDVLSNGTASPGLSSSTSPWSSPLSKTISPLSRVLTPSPTAPSSTSIASASGTTSTSSPTVDRLARLRNLIKEVKATTHLLPRS